MEINFLALFFAALLTFVVGFAWCNPRVFATILMNISSMKVEKIKAGIMFLTFGI